MTDRFGRPYPDQSSRDDMVTNAVSYEPNNFRDKNSERNERMIQPEPSDIDDDYENTGAENEKGKREDGHALGVGGGPIQENGFKQIEDFESRFTRK